MTRFFGTFDANGLATAFYNDDIFPDVVAYGDAPEPTEEDQSTVPPELSRERNPEIPEDALPITFEQWRELLDRPGERAFRDGAVVVINPPPFMPPVLAISDRQFGEGLWREALISFDEYLAFVGPGSVPPPLLAIIDTLPDDDTGNPTPRKVALGLVTGAQSYAFDNPLVDVIRQAQGWTVEHLRERWIAWAAL